MLPIAKDLGVEKYIDESPARIPYFAALRVLGRADFLVVPGTDDPGYTASKIYPYILSKRPIVALFHEKSSVVSVLRDTSAGEAVSFASEDDIDRVAGSFFTQWKKILHRIPFQPATDWRAFQPYTAEEMTRKQCELFDVVVDSEHGLTIRTGVAAA